MYARACGRRVDEVMTRRLVTVGEEAPLVEGVAPMERHRVKRLPVRCAARIVGIAACTDLVRTPAEAARARASAARRRRRGSVSGVSGLHDPMIRIEPLSGEVVVVPDEAARQEVRHGEAARPADASTP